MQDYLLEKIKLQQIEFILKKISFDDCDQEEKDFAIQWLLELSGELMAQLRQSEAQMKNSSSH
ncbi:levan regulatory protein [Pantoea dispersa]|nr:hypothetical protein [Pantoea dispersa]KTS14756.1 levan regulatory protein [Pantoea dispersa]KTS83202.1 levan regulatory protein [Pantoea dispersa]